MPHCLPINGRRLAEGAQPYASGRLLPPGELRGLLKPFGQVRMVASPVMAAKRGPRALARPIDLFLEHLRHAGLSVEIGPMSSRISGESRDLFRALGGAFEVVARDSDVVLTVTVSNDCPGGRGRTTEAREIQRSPSPGGT